MRVKLIVLRGSNSGMEVKIPMPKCVIGRGDDCHLRPKSDAISRRHCALLVKNSKVYLRDLKSRNGTFVNGERVEGDRQLKGGEHLRIGPLEFEVVVDRSFGGEKKPVVRDVKDAAARTAAGSANDDDISTWLEQADNYERELRMSDPDTRQFKIDETDREALENAIEGATDTDVEGEASPGGSDSDHGEAETAEDPKSGVFSFFKRSSPKKYGKLPQRPSTTTGSSKEAAEDMLKKLFNRR